MPNNDGDLKCGELLYEWGITQLLLRFCCLLKKTKNLEYWDLLRHFNALHHIVSKNSICMCVLHLSVNFLKSVHACMKLYFAL